MLGWRQRGERGLAASVSDVASSERSLVEGAALRWVLQLRWIAAAVQAALLVAAALVDMRLPFAPLIAIAGITAATNLLFVLGDIHRGPGARPWLVVVQLIDVGLLTALLYYTGGPANPAVALYIVHVAIAAMVLGWHWAWMMVALSTLGYAALLYEHQPLPPPSPTLLELGYDETTPATLGTWLAYVTVAVMMTYFIGRIRAALRARDAELAQARSLIAKQERLAALTTLAAGAAHELSTPLGTIAVAAAELERASQQGTVTESLRDDAGLIREEVQRCREVLDRMSGRAGTQARGEALPFEAEAIHEELVAALPRTAPGRLRVQLVDETPPERSQAKECLDSGLLAGLVPVVENALLASDEKARDTSTRVRTSSPSGSPATAELALVDVTLRRTKNSLRIEVRDRGPGMDASTLARIGEPFFSTRGPRGMGLGVFLARLTAERHGGRLDIESRPGEGTLATFEMPRHAAANGTE